MRVIYPGPAVSAEAASRPQPHARYELLLPAVRPGETVELDVPDDVAAILIEAGMFVRPAERRSIEVPTESEAFPKSSAGRVRPKE